MKVFPRTMKELSTVTTREALIATIRDVRYNCTNVYSPKYKELSKLYKWIEKNIPDERVHD